MFVGVRKLVSKKTTCSADNNNLSQHYTQYNGNKNINRHLRILNKAKDIN